MLHVTFSPYKIVYFSDYGTKILTNSVTILINYGISHYVILYAAATYDGESRFPSHFLWRSQRKKRTDGVLDCSRAVSLAVGSRILQKEKNICPV